jgi:hypothetical protein
VTVGRCRSLQSGCTRNFEVAATIVQ